MSTAGESGTLSARGSSDGSRCGTVKTKVVSVSSPGIVAGRISLSLPDASEIRPLSSPMSLKVPVFSLCQSVL
jgi:hypothetical protein